MPQFHRTITELAADALAARLDHALEGVGIKLRCGRPSTAGTERGETLRVELFLDGLDTKNLLKLIGVLENAATARKLAQIDLVASARDTVMRQLLFSREGQLLCASLSGEQRALLDEVVEGPLTSNVAQLVAGIAEEVSS